MFFRTGGLPKSGGRMLMLFGTVVGFVGKVGFVWFVPNLLNLTLLPMDVVPGLGD